MFGCFKDNNDNKVQVCKHDNYVDIDKCTACGECQKVCPIEVSSRFDEGLQNQKAAFQLYPQAMPSAYTIEKKGVAPCKASCPANPSFQGCLALINHGKYKEALEILSASYETDKTHGGVVKYLGLTMLELNDITGALAYFSELSLIKGFEIEGYNYQIKALVENKEYVSWNLCKVS